MLTGAALIFIARVCDVSFGTVRTLLLVRGRRSLAAMVGFCEILLYLASLTYVLKAGLQSPLNIVAYAGGFATGNFCGSLLEEKLLSGHVLVEIIFSDLERGHEMTESLRDQGFGTTVLQGEGRDGPRLILKVICDRKDRKNILQQAAEREGVFAFTSDLRSVNGGQIRRKGK